MEELTVERFVFYLAKEDDVVVNVVNVVVESAPFCQSTEILRTSVRLAFAPIRVTGTDQRVPMDGNKVPSPKLVVET